MCGYEPLTMGRRVKTEKKRSVVREGEIKKNENRKKFRSTLYLYIIIITHIVRNTRVHAERSPSREHLDLGDFHPRISIGTATAGPAA